MTTEVAILNKSAVALAADSAVTITSRHPERSSITKIYVDANKLFELVKGEPVGLMIYNSANVAGIPWETLLKEYRIRRPGAAFPRLEDYADSFVKFVAETIAPVLTEADEKAQLVDSFAPIANEMYKAWAPSLLSIKSRVARRERFAEILEEFEETLSTIDLCDWAADLDEGALWDRWRGEIVDTMPSRTDEFQMTKPLRERFGMLMFRAFLRLEQPFGVWSGLVVAGFGEDEMFPSVCHARIGGFIADRLVKVESSVNSISNDRPAIIQPYAQTSEALMFLQGIDPEVSNAVSRFWRTWTGDLQDDVVQIVEKESQVTAQHIEAVRRRLEAHFNTSWQAFKDFMDQEFHQRRLEPIEASAGFLSKREIADLAENLVDLTTLRNRVSLDRQETVGGATDVAVISKGDGFVWVRRKHYFDRDRNPAWATRQALTDVVSRLQAVSSGDGARDGTPDG